MTFLRAFELLAKLPFFVAKTRKNTLDRKTIATTNGNLFFDSNNCCEHSKGTENERNHKNISHWREMVNGT